MRVFLSLIVLFAAVGCASGPKMASEVEADLKEKWSARVGKATKADFIQEFGQAEWCRSRTVGGETCRFRKKHGTKWTGTETDRKHHSTFDEVIGEFDANGVLRSAETKAQR